VLSNQSAEPVHIPESELLSLPDNLRKTYLIAASEGECNATQASILTGRSRAIESSYLNQLVRMGWLAKYRNSRTLCFHTVSGLKREPKLIQTDVFSQTRTQPSVNQYAAKAGDAGCHKL
jgi:hypothetical protein